MPFKPPEGHGDAVGYGNWLPFSAAANDCTVYGPMIYQNAVDGMYGAVSDYAQLA